MPLLTGVDNLATLCFVQKSTVKLDKALAINKIASLAVPPQGTANCYQLRLSSDTE